MCMCIDSFLSFDSYELLPSVREFLSRPVQNFIDGEWVGARSGKVFEKRDPATNEVVASVAQSEGEDVDRAVASARRAFESSEWSKMPTGRRQDLLLRFADLLQVNAEELTQIECLDNGSSVSRGSSMMMANFVKYFAGLATKVYGDTLVPTIGFPGMDLQAYTLRQPVGVVADIIPEIFGPRIRICRSADSSFPVSGVRTASRPSISSRSRKLRSGTAVYFLVKKKNQAIARCVDMIDYMILGLGEEK